MLRALAGDSTMTSRPTFLRFAACRPLDLAFDLARVFFFFVLAF